MVRRGISVRPGGIRPGLPVVAAVLTVLAVPALLAMAGCASDGEAVALPSLESQAAAVTASPSSTADQSEADQRAEVEDAVRAYFAAMDRSVRNGSGDPYVAMVTAECTCRQFAQAVDREWARAPLVGAGVHLDDADVTAVEAMQALATVNYRTDGYTQSTNGQTSRVAAFRVKSFLRLAQVQGRWLVADEDVMDRVAQ